MTGAPAPTVESIFPKFLDGDVLITAGLEGWRLHSSTLCQASTRIKILLGSAKTSKSKPNNVRYTLELGPGEDEKPYSKLTLKTSNKATLPDLDLLFSNRSSNPIQKALDNVFRMLYHLDLRVCESNATACIQDCNEIRSAAVIIGVERLAGKAVEPYLIRLGRPFSETVANNPGVWANFAYDVRAEEIFKDAVVHLVGVWKAMNEDARVQLNQHVRALVEAKVKLLDHNKQAIEIRMVGHFPKVIHRAKDSDRVRRSQYSNEIYWWISQVLFLQWSGQNLLAKGNYEADDGGYTFYKKIATGGEAYLDRAALAHWHQYCPMTGTGAAILEQHIASYKDEIKDFVAPLMVNRTRYDPSVSGELPYLTCCVVEKEDLPWTECGRSDTIVIGERKRPLETGDINAEEVDRSSKRKSITSIAQSEKRGTGHEVDDPALLAMKADASNFISH